MTSGSTKHFQMTGDKCHFFGNPYFEDLDAKPRTLTCASIKFLLDCILKGKGVPLLHHYIHISPSPHPFAAAVLTLVVTPLHKG